MTDERTPAQQALIDLVPLMGRMPYGAMAQPSAAATRFSIAVRGSQVTHPQPDLNVCLPLFVEYFDALCSTIIQRRDYNSARERDYDQLRSDMAAIQRVFKLLSESPH